MNKFFLKSVIYLNPFLMGISAMGLIFLNSTLQARTMPIFFYIATFFAVTGIYIYNALGTKSPEDKINKPLRWLYFSKNARIWKLISVACVLASVILLGVHIKTYQQSLYVGIAAFFALSYCVFSPIHFAKKIPYFKSCWVSLSWVFAFIYLADVFSITHEAASNWQLFFVFNWLLIDTLALDYFDITGDKFYGVKTLPQVLPSPYNRHFILLWSFLLFIISICFLWNHDRTLLYFVVSAYQFYFTFLALRYARKSEAFFDFLIMSWRLAPPIIVLFNQY